MQHLMIQNVPYTKSVGLYNGLSKALTEVYKPASYTTPYFVSIVHITLIHQVNI